MQGHGSAQGWWGAPPEVEAFLDELIAWREIGYNACAFRDDYNRYVSLPDWAWRTLERPARDPREALLHVGGVRGGSDA